MAAFEFTIKDSATPDMLDKLNKFIGYAQTGMVAGMREFESYEIKNEMSGRPGLNWGHGMAGLAGSWHIEQEGKGLDFIVRMANTKSTFYAEVHQKGMTITAKNSPYLTFKLPDGQWRKAKSVEIPKRLNIPENFTNKAIGYRMIEDQIQNALKKAGL